MSLFETNSGIRQKRVTALSFGLAVALMMFKKKLRRTAAEAQLPPKTTFPAKNNFAITG